MLCYTVVVPTRIAFAVCLFAASVCVARAPDSTATTDSLLGLINLQGSKADNPTSPVVSIDSGDYDLELAIDTFTATYPIVPHRMARSILLYEHARRHGRQLCQVISPMAVHLALFHAMGVPVVAVGRGNFACNTRPDVFMDGLVSAQRVTPQVRHARTRVEICFTLLQGLRLLEGGAVVKRALREHCHETVRCSTVPHRAREVVNHKYVTYQALYVQIDAEASIREFIQKVESAMDSMGLPLSVPTPELALVKDPAGR